MVKKKLKCFFTQNNVHYCKENNFKMTEVTVRKSRFIEGNYQVTQEEALKNLLKISKKINEFNKLPMRCNDIEKISEILNMVNEQMLDLIAYDSDAIYYGLMYSIASVLSFYKENKSVYDSKPADVVSKFEKLLNTSTGMTMMYLKNHDVRVDSSSMLEEDMFDILIN